MNNATPEELYARVIANRRHITGNSNSTPAPTAAAALRNAIGSRTPHSRAAVETAIRSLGRDPSSYRMESQSMLHVMAGGRVPGSDVDAIAEALGNPANAPAFHYRASTTMPTTDVEHPTFGGVRQPEQPAAASLSDAPPPPPDVAARIRANREREKPHAHSSDRQSMASAHQRHARVAEQVRAEMRGSIHPPTNEGSEYASRTAAGNDVPPPPSVVDRIQRNRGVK
ncbi:MAG: hypothetical protein JSU08_15265 [Acidobacteria bacterium]|nr:hypothetical protein [Acidobacteriota bacterium]